MKAVYFKSHGDLDALTYGERPLPKTGPSDVLVRVKACALNYLDIWVRQGLPGMKIPLPHIPGNDVAGVIEKVGVHTKGVRPGDKVMVAPGLSCGRCESCKAGRDHLCPEYDVLGQVRDGGYAEYVSVPAANILPMPAHLSFEEAASFPLVFQTAWHMLVTEGQIRTGETVLIQAAGSGVGIAAIQVAKLWGVRIIVTVGSDDKAAKARALGADEVINYRKKDFLEEVRRKTGKRGVDLVVEHIGKTVFEKSLRCLAKGGRLITCGATTGREARLDLRLLFSRNLTVHGIRMGTLRGLKDAVRHLNAGRLYPVVDKLFPLEKAAEAQKYMLDRKHFGKIVLTV